MDNSDKTILSLCAGTKSWEAPYIKAGYNVISITLPEYDVTKVRFSDFGFIVFIGQNKARNKVIICEDVYGILAAPPCTQFSFARSWTNNSRDMRQGMEIVNACFRIVEECLHAAWRNKNIKSFKFWALENPAKGYLSRFIGRPFFEFSPNEFGDIYTKPTALYGYFNTPKKIPVEAVHTNFAYDRALQQLPEGYKRSPDMLNNRACRRAITPPGFAKAFFKANR